MSDDAIVHDITYPHPIHRVWRALTNSDALGTWLMPNDFQPHLGHRFTFRMDGAQDWSGVVECEVVELIEPTRVAYTWRGGPQLPSTLVTFALESTADGGTHLHLEHTGFGSRVPNEFSVRDILDQGWGSKLLRDSFPALLAKMAADEAGSIAKGEPTVGIKRVQTVGVWVSDQDRALDFYVNKLGFIPTMDATFEGLRWIEVTPAGAETAITLLKPGPGQPGATIGGMSRAVLSTDDIEATYTTLVARGVEFVEKPALQPWGMKQALVADPDGNVFVMVER